MMIHFSDEALMDGLRNRDTRVIEFIYHEYGLGLRHFIRKNSGDEEDVKDILQDTIAVVYERCTEPTFRLACGFKTYFMSVGRNLWLQRLERKFRLRYQAEFSVNEDKECYYPDELVLHEETLEIKRLLHKYLMSLPVDCRRLLELYSLSVPIAEIARMLKMKSKEYVRTRKYTCKHILRRKIMEDPVFRQYLNYD